jgi:hypothetical protein
MVKTASFRNRRRDTQTFHGIYAAAAERRMSCMGTHFVTMTPATFTFLGGALTDRDILRAFADRKITQNQKLLNLGKTVVLSSFNGTQNQGILRSDSDHGLKGLANHLFPLSFFQCL